MHSNFSNKPGLKMYGVESTDLCQNVGSKSQKLSGKINTEVRSICTLLLPISCPFILNISCSFANESAFGPEVLIHRWHGGRLKTQ